MDAQRLEGVSLVGASLVDAQRAGPVARPYIRIRELYTDSVISTPTHKQTAIKTKNTAVDAFCVSFKRFQEFACFMIP